jgi:Tfp pilus assembly protein PilV
MVFRKGVSGIPTVDDKGMTLLEVLIAICIFMVIALALTTMNASTWYTTHASKSGTEGSILAAGQLEEMISRKFADGDTDGMDASLIQGDHSITTDDGRYTCTYRIKDGDILPGTKTVQINVIYNTHGSKTNTIHYNYLLPLRK